LDLGAVAGKGRPAPTTKAAIASKPQFSFSPLVMRLDPGVAIGNQCPLDQFAQLASLVPGPISILVHKLGVDP
jgi:hypothetical protein